MNLTPPDLSSSPFVTGFRSTFKHQHQISIRRRRACWLQKELFLILSCSPLSLHHSWNDFVHNVNTILVKLPRRDFPLPELFIPCISSCLLCGLTMDSKGNFSSCHKSSIRLRSGLSGGVCHQVMLFSSKEACARLEACLGSLSCMN